MFKILIFFFLSLKRGKMRKVKSSPCNSIFGAFLSGLYFLQFRTFENIYFWEGVPKQRVVDITWNLVGLVKCIHSDSGII